MLESALIAGLVSVGIEVMRLGVISTPGVAYLTKAQGASASVIIFASHNPVDDNGIKFFGSDGFKLSYLIRKKKLNSFLIQQKIRYLDQVEKVLGQ